MDLLEEYALLVPLMKIPYRFDFICYNYQDVLYEPVIVYHALRSEDGFTITWFSPSLCQMDVDTLSVAFVERNILSGLWKIVKEGEDIGLT